MKPLALATVALPMAAIAADAVSATGVRAESAGPALLGPGQAMEYVLGVVTVMVALGVFAFALRRLQQRQAFGGGGLMRVHASLPLGGKERLLLVEADGERLLLGVSPGGVRLVHHLAPADPAPASQEPAQGKWLSRVLNGEGAR